MPSARLDRVGGSPEQLGVVGCPAGLLQRDLGEGVALLDRVRVRPAGLPAGFCRLPVGGQRTRTNSRTRKGKRKTVANKKKATK